MKLWPRGAVGTLLLLILILGGCSEEKKAPEPQKGVTSSEVKKEVGEAEQVPSTYPQDLHQEYYLTVTAQLDRLKAKLEELKKDLAAKPAEVRNAFQERVERLEKSEEGARDRLRQLTGTATEATWYQMKKGLQEAVDNLEKSYNDLAAQLNSTAKILKGTSPVV